MFIPMLSAPQVTPVVETPAKNNVFECVECGFPSTVLKRYNADDSAFALDTCPDCFDVFTNGDGRGTGHRLATNLDPSAFGSRCDHGDHPSTTLHFIGDGWNDFLAFCPEHCAMSGCASGKES